MNAHQILDLAEYWEAYHRPQTCPVCGRTLPGEFFIPTGRNQHTLDRAVTCIDCRETPEARAETARRAGVASRKDYGKNRIGDDGRSRAFQALEGHLGVELWQGLPPEPTCAP